MANKAQVSVQNLSSSNLLVSAEWDQDAIKADPRGWINAMSCYAERIDGGEAMLLPFIAKSEPANGRYVPRPLPERTTIYFVGGTEGPIKIGMAVDAKSRLRTLQMSSPVLLSILASVEDAPARERAYHKQFAEHRLHGEWFSPHDDILAEIERLSTPGTMENETIAPKLRVLDLFSGIGGFSLGLERTNGFETVAFCEIEEFPRRVLAKHWPDVPCYTDVRELTGERLAADGIAVDVICGGFPCQDISTAGNGAGLAGERSGLWSEIARLVGELRPRYVIVENVAALLGRGLGSVLGDLATLGYDAEWHCIPASAVGAPHRRDRIWIIAHPRGEQYEGAGDAIWRAPAEGLPQAAMAYPPFMLGNGRDDYAASSLERQASQSGNGGWSQAVANALLIDEQGIVASFLDPQEWARQVERSARPCGDGFGGWAVEPGVGRVVDGVPGRAHRLKALGNAVVPQIPELIGRAILAAQAKQAA